MNDRPAMSTDDNEASVDLWDEEDGFYYDVMHKSDGQHLFLTRNINAPLPGTYNPADPTSGTRPLGINENIDQYSSDGTSERNRLTINGNYELPIGKGRKYLNNSGKIADYAIGGWSTSMVFRAQTGEPISISPSGFTDSVTNADGSTTVTDSYTSPSGSGINAAAALSFGADESLTVGPGWDNVTGYGQPNGLPFIQAVGSRHQ